MTSQGLTEADADTILEKVVAFEDGSRYERLKPITNFRRDDGVARILYLCRRSSNESESPQTEQAGDEKFVMKIKVQVSCAEIKEPVEGPNAETTAEIHALKTFAANKRCAVPHLETWKKLAQGANGLFLGGYLVITIMTLMPGETLLDLGFWSLEIEEQELIRRSFMTVLKDVWRDGFIPYDRGLRNILWEKETMKCSIVDFEHYHLNEDEREMNEKEEMEQWGVLRRPALDWYSEWAVWSPPKKSR